MYQLFKVEEDGGLAEYVMSIDSSHVIGTAVSWHKADMFGWEIHDSGLRIGWCDEKGNVGFETNMGSELNPARFMAYYVNLD